MEAGSTSHQYSYSGKSAHLNRGKGIISKYQASEPNKQIGFSYQQTLIYEYFTQKIHLHLLGVGRVEFTCAVVGGSLWKFHFSDCVSEVPTWESLKPENSVGEIRLLCIVSCGFLLLLNAHHWGIQFCVTYHLLSENSCEVLKSK